MGILVMCVLFVFVVVVVVVFVVFVVVVVVGFVVFLLFCCFVVLLLCVLPFGTKEEVVLLFFLQMQIRVYINYSLYKNISNN